MTTSLGVWMWLAMGCDDGEPPLCETEGPTCVSQLVLVNRNNDSAEFELRVVAKAEGLNLDLRCPLRAEDDGMIGDITWFCGAGQVTFLRTTPWPAELEAGFGSQPLTVVRPNYSDGIDPCGNLCNNGVEEL